MTTRTRRRPWLRIALGAYAAALLASTAVRVAAPEPPLPEYRNATHVSAPDGEDTLRIAWRETQGGDEAGLPLVLLHGSPGSADNFSQLQVAWALRALAEEARDTDQSNEPKRRVEQDADPAAPDSQVDADEERSVVRVYLRVPDSGRRTITPDLPGFGASDHRVADYSSRGHADSTLKLLDHLHVERFHVLGFSMGGAVALHLANRAPDRVASVILMSSIGVQELELLGDYTVNHGLHGLQLGLFWGVRNLVPHFGALDMAVARSYARNFYDTDQRPLRGILESLEAPVFIIHGEQDPLVPAAAAREHHRIAPHSELWMRPDSHFFLFRGGNDLAARIEEFLGRVEAGEAPTRADAEPERLRRAALSFDDMDLPPFTGPALLIVFLLLVFAAYASEDLTCITAGLLVAQGRLDFPVAVAACYAGILSSDLGLAWLARDPGAAGAQAAAVQVVGQRSPVRRGFGLAAAAGAGRRPGQPLPARDAAADMPRGRHPAHEPAPLLLLLRSRGRDLDARLRRRQRTPGTRGGGTLRRPPAGGTAWRGAGAGGRHLHRTERRRAALHLARAPPLARPAAAHPALGVLADVGVLPAARALHPLAGPATRQPDGVHRDQSRHAARRPARRVEERHSRRPRRHRRRAAGLEASTAGKPGRSAVTASARFPRGPRTWTIRSCSSRTPASAAGVSP